MKVDGKIIKLELVIYNNIYSGKEKLMNSSDVVPPPIIKVSFVK